MISCKSHQIVKARKKLKDKELNFLQDFVKKGQKSARPLTRARILLLANQQKGDNEIAEILDVGRNTVWWVRKRCREEGLEVALKDKPRPGQPKKYKERHEADIIALACTKPPVGNKRWSIMLLTEELKKRSGFETVNRESVRLVLKKAGLSLG